MPEHGHVPPDKSEYISEIASLLDVDPSAISRLDLLTLGMLKGIATQLEAAAQAEDVRGRLPSRTSNAAAAGGQTGSRHAAVAELVANESSLSEGRLRAASVEAVEEIAEAVVEDFDADETDPVVAANAASEADEFPAGVEGGR